MKPQRQAFLLTKVEGDKHHVSDIDKLLLPMAAGFSTEQCIVQDNQVIALADQFDLTKNVPLKDMKNLFLFEMGKWTVRHLKG